jgi:hypothetical protein
MSHPMTSFPVHPLTLLFYGLTLTALGALIQLLRRSRRRRSDSYSLAALTLLGCLDVMGFLSGFSIGPLVLVIAAVVAILLALSVRTYRRPVRLLALATLLLAFGMWTGAFAVIRQILTLGLALGTLVASLQLGRTWPAWRSLPFGDWALTLCACLGGLSLLVGATAGGIWAMVPLVAAGLGLGLAMLSPRRRVALLAIAAANLLLGLGFLSA